MVISCKQIQYIEYQLGYMLENRLLTRSSIVGNYNGDVIAKMLGYKQFSLATTGCLSHLWWGATKGQKRKEHLKRSEPGGGSHSWELSNTQGGKRWGNLLASPFLLSSNLL